MANPLFSANQRAEHVFSILALDVRDEEILDAISLGAPHYTQTLRQLADRSIKYHEAWEYSHDQLRQDPLRYEQLSADFSEIARAPPEEGREYVSYGQIGGDEHYVRGFRKWMKNPELLFETLAEQDATLFGQDGNKVLCSTIDHCACCPWQWFLLLPSASANHDLPCRLSWHNAMVFGLFINLRRFVTAALASKPRFLEAFNKYCTVM